MTRVPVCENCGRPATIRWRIGQGEYAHNCDRCRHIAGYDPEPLSQERGLLDRTGAASYLGVSLDAFDAHIKPNVRVRMVGSKPMFTRAALDDYAESGAAEL